MDKLSILGVIVGFSAIIGGFGLHGGTLSTLFDLPAIVIVIGGTFGAVLFQNAVATIYHRYPDVGLGI